MGGKERWEWARLRFSRLGSECRAGCEAAGRQESTEALKLPELLARLFARAAQHRDGPESGLATW